MLAAGAQRAELMLDTCEFGCAHCTPFNLQEDIKVAKAGSEHKWQTCSSPNTCKKYLGNLPVLAGSSVMLLGLVKMYPGLCSTLLSGNCC